MPAAVVVAVVAALAVAVAVKAVKNKCNRRQHQRPTLLKFRSHNGGNLRWPSRRDRMVRLPLSCRRNQRRRWLIQRRSRKPPDSNWRKAPLITGRLKPAKSVRKASNIS